jgi:hypothetical protein
VHLQRGAPGNHMLCVVCLLWTVSEADTPREGRFTHQKPLSCTTCSSVVTQCKSVGCKDRGRARRPSPPSAWACCSTWRRRGSASRTCAWSASAAPPARRPSCRCCPVPPVLPALPMHWCSAVQRTERCPAACAHQCTRARRAAAERAVRRAAPRGRVRRGSPPPVGCRPARSPAWAVQGMLAAPCQAFHAYM